MIGDRKVCGTACRKMPSGSIVHSTMLYDTNMEYMLHAITPNQQKLAKNGVESVRQRITLLKDYTSLSLDEVKTLIIRTLCDGERMLTIDEISKIEQIEKQYNQ
jgi:lipoic acid synthetase/lipoate-protein ligase A